MTIEEPHLLESTLNGAVRSISSVQHLVQETVQLIIGSQKELIMLENVEGSENKIEFIKSSLVSLRQSAERQLNDLAMHCRRLDESNVMVRGTHNNDSGLFHLRLKLIGPLASSYRCCTRWRTA
jgi:hypothetical protein